MTRTTIHIAMHCYGRSLGLGPGEELDITKITGLESSDLTVGLSDLAVVDGSSLDGRHIKARPIHIEASFRSLRDGASKREKLVRFFNPKQTGTLEATIGGITRSIDYELEGWTIKEQRNLDARVGFVADLICPDPYFYGEEQTAQWGLVDNEGDVETGWRATLTGACANPKITDDDTGEYMRVRTTLKAGDVLVISTEDRKQTITLNGESAFRLIDRRSEPFKLQPGITRLSVSADSGTVQGVPSFRARYFGI